MNLHTGFFPSYGHRRKQTIGGYHLPLNNQQHHPASSVHSARSLTETGNTNDSFLPSIVAMNAHQDGHRPYRRNDFANNHLFLAKRKLARIFLAQPTRNLQATSDLIHLFDPQEPKSKNRNRAKAKPQETGIETKSTTPLEQDIHLSVVNLALKRPYPPVPTRDPLSAISRQSRTQTTNSSIKGSRQSADTTHTATRQHIQTNSLHSFADTTEVDGLIDHDNVSDTISTTIVPFDSSLLCVKSIIPSAIPLHANPHALQHR